MLLEVSAYPKPGNVHRTRDFTDLKYIHFLGTISGLGEYWRRSAKMGIFLSKRGNLPHGGLGKVIRDACRAMLKWQSDGNTSLGTILLLTPLAVSAGKTFYENKLSPENIRRNLNLVINEGGYRDTLQLYQAIQDISPGGLGRVDVLDIRNSSSIMKIKKKKISLKKIFEISSDYDSISQELSSGFPITFEVGYPFLMDRYQLCSDLNAAILDTYLQILWKLPDTLIARKVGWKTAFKISQMSGAILKKGGCTNEDAMEKIWQMDRELGDTGGFLNPGATADLTCSSISIAVLDGLRP